MAADIIKTMVHFAIKSGKIIIGADQLCISKKKCPVMILDENLSANTVKKLLTYSDRLILSTDFETTLELPLKGCKALGLTDRNMCRAILKEINTTKLYRILGGNNLV